MLIISPDDSPTIINGSDEEAVSPYPPQLNFEEADIGLIV